MRQSLWSPNILGADGAKRLQAVAWELAGQPTEEGVRKLKERSGKMGVIQSD